MNSPMGWTSVGVADIDACGMFLRTTRGPVCTHQPAPTDDPMSMTTEHPLLTEHVIRLKNDLNASFKLDPSVEEKFKEGLQQAGDKILSDIQGLTVSIRDIRESFSKLSKQFNKFDLDSGLTEAELVGEGGLTRLGPKWDKFGDRFDELLNLSLKNAADAKAVLDLHNMVLFPDDAPLDPSSFQAIKDEIQGCIKSIEEDGTKAYEIEKGFTSLAGQIRNFEDEIEATVKERTEVVVAGLKEARQRVGELRDRLSKVKSETASVGLACAACLTAGALSAVLLIFTLSPAAIHLFAAALGGAIPSALNFNAKLQEKKRIKAEIEKCNETIMKLSENHEVLLAYQTTLGGTNANIENIAAKIDSIAGIWHYLKGDLQLLHSQLDKAAGPNFKVTSLFGRKVAMSRKLYGKLSLLLDAYVHGVSSDGSGNVGMGAN
ncbi:hypothetical protein C8Q79DRAFT_989930 [Trametes meyenii]|nr:hypothetical protein C8Q79DRAFT_989930 [Trametes meyenii]